MYITCAVILHHALAYLLEIISEILDVIPKTHGGRNDFDAVQVGNHRDGCSAANP